MCVEVEVYTEKFPESREFSPRPPPSPAIGQRLAFRVGALPVPRAALIRNFYEQKSGGETDASGNLPSEKRVLAREAVRGA